MYKLIVVVLFLSLISCQKKLTYPYLMTHPLVVKEELKRCEDKNMQNEMCQTILNAATHLSEIISDQQSDPEKFGQKILDMQIGLNQTQKNLEAAEKILSDLKVAHASDDQLRQAEENTNQLRKNCAEQQEQLNISIAVVGINTPE